MRHPFGNLGIGLHLHLFPAEIGLHQAVLGDGVLRTMTRSRTTRRVSMTSSSWNTGMEIDPSGSTSTSPESPR